MIRWILAIFSQQLAFQYVKSKLSRASRSDASQALAILMDVLVCLTLVVVVLLLTYVGQQIMSLHDSLSRIHPALAHVVALILVAMVFFPAVLLLVKMLFKRLVDRIGRFSRAALKDSASLEAEREAAAQPITGDQSLYGILESVNRYEIFGEYDRAEKELLHGLEKYPDNKDLKLRLALVKQTNPAKGVNDKRLEALEELTESQRGTVNLLAECRDTERKQYIEQ